MDGSITPMPGSIICGVDSSDSAEGAIRVARDLSTVLERRLVFVRVVEPGTPDETIDAIAEHLRRLVDSKSRTDQTAALWLVDVGHPADRLVVAAEDEKASMIVLGFSGHRSSLVDSVSAEVSRRAPCPVVVVPRGADDRLSGRPRLASPAMNPHDEALDLERVEQSEAWRTFTKEVGV